MSTHCNRFFHTFSYYGCGEGVAYFTKSKRISGTFGYKHKWMQGIYFHMVHVVWLFVISTRINEIVYMCLHTLTDTSHPFSYYGCWEGVAYFTESRRISGTFGYKPKQKQGILFHMMCVGWGFLILPRIKETLDSCIHTVTNMSRPFSYYGCGEGVVCFTKSRRISGTFG